MSKDELPSINDILGNSNLPSYKDFLEKKEELPSVEEYITESISDYMFCEYNSGDSSTVWGGTSKIIHDEDEPGEYEYGGFWYRKGKKQQKKLEKILQKKFYQKGLKKWHLIEVNTNIMV